MAEHEVWWSLQPFLDDEDAIPFEDPINQQKQQLFAGTAKAYDLAIRHGVKIAWGTDILFTDWLTERQGKMLAKMTRSPLGFSAAEALRMATSRNAELLAMSGPRNPYPGRLGVVEEGALADLLLVDGDPVANIDLLATPDTSLAVIMKGGAIVKNILPPGAA